MALAAGGNRGDIDALRPTLTTRRRASPTETVRGLRYVGLPEIDTLGFGCPAATMEVRGLSYPALRQWQEGCPVGHPSAEDTAIRTDRRGFDGGKGA